MQDLEVARASIAKQLLALQSRLRAVSDEGELKLAQKDKILRRKAAEVMVLKSNTGLSVTRARDLRALVQQHRQKLVQARKDAIDRKEQLELAQLKHMESALG